MFHEKTVKKTYKTFNKPYEITNEGVHFIG